MSWYCFMTGRGLAIGDFFYCFNQPLDLFIARVTRAADAHQAFRLQTQSIDDRLGVKITMRNKQATIRKAPRHFRRSYVSYGERDSRRARDVRRWTVQPHSFEVRQ